MILWVTTTGKVGIFGDLQCAEGCCSRSRMTWLEEFYLKAGTLVVRGDRNVISRNRSSRWETVMTFDVESKRCTVSLYRKTRAS